MAEQALVHRSRLPQPLTTLIGREHEIAAITALVGDTTTRLVTLTGPGGVGKTRLALAIAERLDEVYAGDVWFVSLAPLTDHLEVLPTIARTLRIDDPASQPIVERLINQLHHRRLLLILDNVEHVLAVAPEVAQLLTACPMLSVLATGRGPLHLHGEHQYPVPPLKIPDSSGGDSFPALLKNDAVQMFVERAREIDPMFELTEINAPIIAAICRQLGGLPLAVELAAVWIKLIPPENLLERLDKPLSVLTGGPQDAPSRQRTMRRTLQWSYDLLTDNEQLLFREVSVFSGGCTLEALEAVASGAAVLETLSSLVDKSLVRRFDQPGSATRYDMLVPVREFAMERLSERESETTSVRNKHVQYFLSMVEGLFAQMDGRDRLAWLARVEAEHDNLRSALRWLHVSKQTELGLQIVAEIGRFWTERGYGDEGLIHTETFLQMDGGSQRTMHRARVLYRTASWLRLIRGEIDTALSLVDEACSIAAEHNDRSSLAYALFGRGVCHEQCGDADRAQNDWETALAIFREQGTTAMIGRVLVRLGNLARNQGELDRARETLEEALTLARTGDIAYIIATATGNLGLVEEESGNDQLALDCYREWLTLFYELGINHGISEPMERMARIAGRRTATVLAVSLLGASSVLRERGSKTWFSLADRLDPDEEVAALRAAMSTTDFQNAWDEGRAMSVEDAIEMALQLSEMEQDNSHSAISHGLTPRELDVLQFVAQGLTDPQIAEKLFISPRTVSSHLTSVYGKLGVSSRAAATRIAVEQGLL